MIMLDRLHHVLIPRLEGCLALVLIVFGVFAPPLTNLAREAPKFIYGEVSAKA